MISTHRKFGVDTFFFELFLPNRIAKKVIPIVAVIAILGSVLLLVQEIRMKRYYCCIQIILVGECR